VDRGKQVESSDSPVKFAGFYAFALVIIFAFTGCAGLNGLVRKTGPKYEAEIQSWQKAIDNEGGNGMWLVSRGYRKGDDMVAILTCSSFSHVGILDTDKGEVIESLWNGNVTNSIANFVEISHRVVLVKPEGWTPETGGEALAKVRSQLGKKYDFSGIIGLPSSNRWYCSELASWCWGRQPDRKGPWHVIHPRRLTKMGTVLFDSGSRDGEPD
jgi:hypothetical protein